MNTDNINKLEVGMKIKNYKELCSILGWTVQTSNSKKAQLASLELYCKFHSEGHKIVIDEIYETPLDRKETRGRPTAYGNIVELLIITLVDEFGGVATISSSKLMNYIGMTNMNYSKCQENLQGLSEHTGIKLNYIYDFYNLTNGSLKSAIETALKHLEDKMMMFSTRVVKVKEKGNHAPRIASDAEVDLIMSVTKGVLKEFGYEKVSEIRRTNKWHKFKYELEKALKTDTKFEYFFYAYHMVINQKFVKEEQEKLLEMILDDVNRKEVRKELNVLVQENTMNNAKNRSDKAFTYKKETSILRGHPLYVPNFQKLCDTLINGSARLIHNEVVKIQNQKVINKDLINYLKSSSSDDIDDLM